VRVAFDQILFLNESRVLELKREGCVLADSASEHESLVLDEKRGSRALAQPQAGPGSHIFAVKHGPHV